MRILGIAGSPRKGGNTAILVEEALRSVGDRAQTELIDLSEGPDLANVVEAMSRADGILLGTPSYFGMPSATLKALLDATWDDAKKGRFAGKAGAALAVESSTGGELAAASLAHFFTQHRMVYLGNVVGRGVKEREILYDIKAIRDARELANRVVDYLDRRATAP